MSTSTYVAGASLWRTALLQSEATHEHRHDRQCLAIRHQQPHRPRIQLWSAVTWVENPSHNLVIHTYRRVYIYTTKIFTKIYSISFRTSGVNSRESGESMELSRHQTLLLSRRTIAYEAVTTQQRAATAESRNSVSEFSRTMTPCLT